MVLGVRDTRRALAWGSGRGRHRRGRSSFGGGRLILEIALVLIEISLAPHHSAEESIAAGTPLYCRATGEHPFLARSNVDPAHLRTCEQEAGSGHDRRPPTGSRAPRGAVEAAAREARARSLRCFPAWSASPSPGPGLVAPPARRLGCRHSRPYRLRTEAYRPDGDPAVGRTPAVRVRLCTAPARGRTHPPPALGAGNLRSRRGPGHGHSGGVRGVGPPRRGLVGSRGGGVHGG